MRRSSSSDAARVRRELRFEIRDVLVGVARGKRPAREQRAHLALSSSSPPATMRTPSNSTPSSSIVRLDGRHRARRAAADVGVVRAARDEVAELAAVRVEDRRHDGEIRQVRAAVVRRVQEISVAGRELLRAQDALHAVAHRAQVHGHVRRVRDQRPVGREQRAREIQSLLDVDGVRRVLEHDAHLLGDVHEEVVEHLEHDRIGVAAERLAAQRGGPMRVNSNVPVA